MNQRSLEFAARQAVPEAPKRRAFSVTELNRRIQGLLETELFDVWVEGEVANLKRASSGHVYFSLRDPNSQLRAVCWKTQARRLRFQPRDGMHLLARGGVRVYPPRGEYQLVVETIEPVGKGALQQAFEDLKQRLDAEGLFAPGRKRPLPMLPRRVGVVTSPTGAVIRDILRVLGDDHAGLELLLYPARVQGVEAAGEVAAGIRALGRLPGVDVIVVARGGGSLEDLWPFNDEGVARALSDSPVATISAVGHETDYTISDFVADARAPTPTAAAQRLLQLRQDAARQRQDLETRMTTAANRRLERFRGRVDAVGSHRVFEAERGRISGRRQQLEELERRARSSLTVSRRRNAERVERIERRLEAFRWDRQLTARQERVERQLEKLRSLGSVVVERGRARLGRAAAHLASLSPVAVLGRGYSLVWDHDERRLIRDAGDVEVGDGLKIRLHRGSLEAAVTKKETR